MRIATALHSQIKVQEAQQPPYSSHMCEMFNFPEDGYEGLGWAKIR